MPITPLIRRWTRAGRGGSGTTGRQVILGSLLDSQELAVAIPFLAAIGPFYGGPILAVEAKVAFGADWAITMVKPETVPVARYAYFACCACDKVL